MEQQCFVVVCRFRVMVVVKPMSVVAKPRNSVYVHAYLVCVRSRAKATGYKYIDNEFHVSSRAVCTSRSAKCTNMSIER